MKLSDEWWSGKISRSNETAGRARAGDKNGTGDAQCALKRMWIGVVHPPQTQ